MLKVKESNQKLRYIFFYVSYNALPIIQWDWIVYPFTYDFLLRHSRKRIDKNCNILSPQKKTQKKDPKNKILGTYKERKTKLQFNGLNLFAFGIILRFNMYEK